MATSANSGDFLPARRFEVTRYNRRMARRIARRAKLNEGAVAVAFTFNNLLTMCVFGLVQDLARFVPIVGEYVEAAVSLVSFYFHRIVIVTDENVYVYRDLPFHFPTRQIAAYRRGAGVVRLGSPNPSSGVSRFIRRGQLTFEDGLIAYHSIIWIRRAQYIEQEGNLPADR
jgi:hypothetical protein